jgi:hypothetical protein
MHGINMKPSPVVPTASAAARPALASSVWKDKLDASVAVTVSSKSDTLAKLLQRAGMIGKEQVCDASDIAESLNKTVDQVITTSFLSAMQAELCASAMSYLERGIINEALAADALGLANSKGLPFVEGLKYFGFGW